MTKLNSFAVDISDRFNFNFEFAEMSHWSGGEGGDIPTAL